MCNDEDSRQQMAKKQTVPCYLYIYDKAHMEGMRWGGPALQAKVLPAPATHATLKERKAIARQDAIQFWL